MSKLAAETRVKDVSEFIELLGYQYEGRIHSNQAGELLCYRWFEDRNYHSWSGVELSLHRRNGSVYVETRTAGAISYFDFKQQNKTIKLIKKHFGGSFETDEGKGRYLSIHESRIPPEASGCHLAFNRFGSNLIASRVYISSRNFKFQRPHELKGFPEMARINPWIISNNLCLPFLVSIFEDYWKTTYVALLKCSEKKERIFKSVKISAEKLALASTGSISLEEAFAESLSFQNVLSICKNFSELDPKIKIDAVLRKPYRRRKISLFDSLEEMIKLRHRIIHSADFAILTDEYIKGLSHNLEVAVVKCYQHLTEIYGWRYEKWWHAGEP
ncbi:MAG TPA: hypothetical protein VFX30_03235 [bacterium]|nr:hypothetical protein [bacterium]